MIRVVSYGGGVNSTAMLCELTRRGERVDLILFADTGGEEPWTYEYVPMFSALLREHDQPEIMVVSNAGQHASLEAECLTNKTLPSLAYGFRGCSVKWKRQPMDRYIKKWQPAIDAWARGEKVERLMGIHAGEAHRGRIPDDERFAYSRPLVDWGWWQDDCVKAIEAAGLLVPKKSACFFCPAKKKHEVRELAANRPDLFARCVAMERNAAVQQRTVQGLGRHWSWSDVAAADANQLRLFIDGQDEPCMFCNDGSLCE